MARRFARRAAMGALAALAAMLPTGAWAAWPDRPVRLIVPYQPGGGNDVVARLLSPKVSEAIGQSLLVENRSGAAGTIAGRYVATATPDGYTLLIDSLSIAQNASLFRNPGFNAAQDLVPVAQLVEFPFVVAMNRQVRARSVESLVALAREQPGRLNVAESGSSPRLAAELFRLAAGGISFTFVPYRGSAPAVSSLLSGETDLFFSDLPSIAQHVKDPGSSVIALASSAPRRTPTMPELSTAQEAGIPDFETMSWYGVFAPRGTPPEVIQRMNAALNAALATPEVKERLAMMSAEPTPRSQSDFAAFYQAEIVRWREVIRRSGMPLID